MLVQSSTGPREDVVLLRLEFKSQDYLVLGRIPSYAAWLLDCDMESTYRYERRVLKLLQWKSPPSRWWLKSPTHTLFLEAHGKVFPEACLVMTHRDVANVLPSTADLYFTLLQVGNEGIDPVEVGELVMQQWGTALDRVLAYRSGGHEDRFFDIGNSAFRADAIADVRKLYTWLGRDLTEETEQRMRSWRDNSPRSAHEYSAADFGLGEPSMTQRFSAYRARFGSLL